MGRGSVEEAAPNCMNAARPGGAVFGDGVEQGFGWRPGVPCLLDGFFFCSACSSMMQPGAKCEVKGDCS
eukprot:4690191-Prorocentrum_lima.AAC.1